jgi:hypothetical protein
VGDPAFAENWSEVSQEWSDRYGDKVSGWWFDGGYAHIGLSAPAAISNIRRRWMSIQPGQRRIGRADRRRQGSQNSTEMAD